MDRRNEQADLVARLMEGRLTRREFIVRMSALGLSMTAIGALVAACGSATPTTSSSVPSGGASTNPSGSPSVTAAPTELDVDSATFALTADVQGIDYVVAYDLNTNPVVNQIIEGLMRTDENGQLVPNLATAYTESSDGLTYVYTLRPNVQFHDGTIMTADDVVASMQRHMDPTVASYLASFYERVSSVEKTGDLEVTVHMKSGDALWKYSAATNAAGVTSKAFLDKNGKNVGSPDVGIIGTGPYKFVSWSRGQQVVLEKFDGYWNAAVRPAHVKQGIFKPLVDEATIIQALGTGQIDATFNLGGLSFVQAQKFANLDCVTAPSYNVEYLGFNTTKAPWNDKRVRQALSYAIDKPGTLAASYGNQGAVWHSPITPAQWTFEHDTFQAAYDALPKFVRSDATLAQAKQLVQDAGAVGATGEVLVGNDYDVPVGLAVQSAAQELGMTINVKRMPQQDKFALEFAGTATRDYDMTITIWGSDWPDPAGNCQTVFYGPNLIQNATLYNNPQVNDLIDAQGNETDPVKRAQLLCQIQSLVVEDQPWIVFYYSDTLLVQNKKLAGYKLHPLYYWDAFLADFYGTGK